MNSSDLPSVGSAVIECEEIAAPVEASRAAPRKSRRVGFISFLSLRSENVLQSELNVTIATLAGDEPEVRIDVCVGGVGESRDARPVPVGMVERIEELRAEIDPVILVKLERLDHRGIEGPGVRAV